MNLQDKVISGLFWSFVENIANQGVTFIVGLILARILTPFEFGLIGMVMVVIAIAQTLLDAGFSQALIRKKDCSVEDYSTVFYFNLGISIIIYLTLYFSAEVLAEFFNQPELAVIIKVMGLAVIINAFDMIQKTILTRNLNFRLLTKISLISSIISGMVAIIMAMAGYGVWSLVFRSLIFFFLFALLLWIWNGWRPSLIFSIKSFKELFSFGSKLLASGLIDSIYKNIYALIIGKYFSAIELGYYTRSNQFKNIASQNITAVIQRVSYPALATLQDDNERLTQAYRKLVKSTMFIAFTLMLLMGAMAKSMILALIGEKWLQSVVYLQLIIWVGMFHPLHAINLNILNVKGRSDIFLILEVIKKSLAFPVIIIGVYYGIKVLLMGMIVHTIFAYFLNSYWSGKLIDYSSVKQLWDIIPSFLFAAIISGIIYSLQFILPFDPVPLFLIQATISVILVIAAGETIKLEEYVFLKKTLMEKLKFGSNK
ncbi:MAG: lipopolysaccharide biosynthesis protein [Calditrichia bacterium]